MPQETEATVLIVEDEALIALDLQSIIERAGFKVVGPVNTVEAALAATAREKPQLALLDINLGQSKVFELADALAQGGTPILFVTGHSRVMLTEAHKARPIVTKPFLPDVLLAAVGRLRKQANGQA
jgi:DNA-binding response OmpR family regulator